MPQKGFFTGPDPEDGSFIGQDEDVRQLVGDLGLFNRTYLRVTTRFITFRRTATHPRSFARSSSVSTVFRQGEFKLYTRIFSRAGITSSAVSMVHLYVRFYGAATRAVNRLTQKSGAGQVLTYLGWKKSTDDGTP